jgi:hypothetical protein
MIDKREVKRFNMKFGKFLDPLALFLLIAVFVLPSLAVLNLSPRSRSATNVLGAESKEEVSTVLVGGIHDFIKEERIDFPNEKRVQYNSVMIKHNVGTYSKPILQVSNTFGNDATVNIQGGTENPTGSPIYLIVNNQEYLLQDASGNPQDISVKLPEQSKNIVYLKFETTTPLLFNENVSITIVQK